MCFSKDGNVILESPALPVSEGAVVTLRCQAQTNPHHQQYNFFKDGRPLRSNCSWEMTIYRVSKSDEGLYSCSLTGGGGSEGSWLAVSGDEDELSDKNPVRFQE